ncbi:hypothetical protein COOONC_19084, partial [Cooperia oncophora]
VRDGKIIDAANIFYDERRKADIQVDCEGQILSPGFIDIQINGGFGVDFSSMPSTDEEYERGVAKVSKCLLSHGVTSYLPTVITSPPEVYARASSQAACGNELKSRIAAITKAIATANCVRRKLGQEKRHQ